LDDQGQMEQNGPATKNASGAIRHSVQTEPILERVTSLCCQVTKYYQSLTTSKLWFPQRGVVSEVTWRWNLTLWLWLGIKPARRWHIKRYSDTQADNGCS